MILDANLPDYSMSEREGDLMMFTRKGQVIDPIGAPVLSLDVLAAARNVLPGMDIYALEAEWRGFWDLSGRKRLADADKAFMGWVKRKANRIQS